MEKVDIYVDGAFNSTNGLAGYGIVVVKDNTVLHTEKCTLSKDSPYITARNVYGEVSGAIRAILYATEHGYDDVTIYYDYLGIEMWADKKWKAKQELTQGYVAITEEARKTMSICYKKVKAHTGDKYNEMADDLANSSVNM